MFKVGDRVYIIANQKDNKPNVGIITHLTDWHVIISFDNGDHYGCALSKVHRWSEADSLLYL